MTEPPAPPLPPGQASCDPNRFTRTGSNLTQEIHDVDLEDFAKMLDGTLDRPVINKTGIAGKFDFKWEFVPDEAVMPHWTGIGLDPDVGPVSAPQNPPDGPSIFTAVREQLGLKLEPTKGPRKFIVIDSVERPSEN